jgi:hypothetical protein
MTSAITAVAAFRQEIYMNGIFGGDSGWYGQSVVEYEDGLILSCTHDSGSVDEFVVYVKKVRNHVSIATDVIQPLATSMRQVFETRKALNEQTCRVCEELRVLKFI